MIGQVQANLHLKQKVSFSTRQPNFFLHLSILLIFCFALVSNAMAKENDITFDVSHNQLNALSPEEIFQVVSKVSPYTNAIEENADDVKLTLELERNGEFLEKPMVMQTQTTSITNPASTPQSYIVQAGDTLSSIAYKFNLKVASVKFTNGLTNDVLKPGQTLKIPNTDVANSVIAAAEKAKQQKAAQLAAKQASSRQLASRQRTSKDTAGGDYDGEQNFNVNVPISHNGISRGVSRGHPGIDYRANIGTAVYAAASGRIIETSSGWSGGYGNEVIIDHGSGRISRYAHLSSIRVSAGQTVAQGQVVGLSGNTGWSTGPHLHFEWRINGVSINPF